MSIEEVRRGGAKRPADRSGYLGGAAVAFVAAAVWRMDGDCSSRWTAWEDLDDFVDLGLHEGATGRDLGVLRVERRPCMQPSISAMSLLSSRKNKLSLVDFVIH